MYDDSDADWLSMDYVTPEYVAYLARIQRVGRQWEAHFRARGRKQSACRMRDQAQEAEWELVAIAKETIAENMRKDCGDVPF
jgi:hypothetical protein